MEQFPENHETYENVEKLYISNKKSINCLCISINNKCKDCFFRSFPTIMEDKNNDLDEKLKEAMILFSLTLHTFKKLDNVFEKLGID